MKAGDELAEELLRQIRREFFAKWPDKRFYQERSLLLQAVTYPARYFNDRGAALGEAKYRAIIQTVIDAIKAHGKRAKIKRFSAYFLHSIQAHMSHHGEQYYYESKGARPAGDFIPGIVDAMTAYTRAVDITETLAAVHRALKSKGGRRAIQKGENRARELDLPGLSSGPAAPLQSS
jgi:hypothetical protein